jgi:citryl-CoA lyase
MVQDMTFTTTVSGQTQQGIELRGHALSTLIGKHSFSQVLFLSLTGKLPSTAQDAVLNAILVASIDHGVQSASGFVPRVVAASGNPILPAMASTLLALGPFHGGAVSDAMKVIGQLVLAEDVEQAALALATEYRAAKKRVSGFGHPHYKDADPRAQQLFQIAREAGLELRALDTAMTLEAAIETVVGKRLILNIDGAVAALCVALGLPDDAGNALFGLARVGGSIAHIIEERSSGEWVRRLPDTAAQYHHE